MTFHWSKNAPHIVSVFLPWQQNDGYDSETLVMAESRLNLCLPVVLKHFYRAWGRRDDITRFRENLLPPEYLSVQSGFLVFAEENQAVYQWGIPCDFLKHENPPVYYALQLSDHSEAVWELSHRHISDFLDYLTYGHALAGGAPYGGAAQDQLNEVQLDEVQRTWVTIELASVPMGLVPEPDSQWLLYGRQGIVMDPLRQVWIAAQSFDALETVRQQLCLTWNYQW